VTPQERLAPYKLSDRVLLDGLEDDFAERLYGLLSDPRLEHRVSIVSGFRTYEQQKALYDAWKAGTHNVPSVARPGTSRHETGRAADLDIGWQAPFGWGHVHAVAAEYGLLYPVRGEAWHTETAPGAAPLEEDMTPEQARQLNDIHFALVGARKFSGDSTSHDLATPILSTNHTVQVGLTVNGQPVTPDQFAALVASKIPVGGPGGVTEDMIVAGVKRALREGCG
jgi:hypothetical protein